MEFDPRHFQRSTSLAVTDGPTFRKDFLPLAKQKCSACHGPGKMHPKDWTDYATASANRALIDRRVWEVRDMPMGGSLEEADRKMVHAWIVAGGPEGKDEATPPPTPTPSPSPTPTAAPAPGLTFNGRIQGVFQSRCSACHGPGKMHPKDWTDYATASEHRALIDRRVWEVRDMPMGGNITNEERTEIHDWIQAGAPQSGTGPGPSPSPTPAPSLSPSPSPNPTSSPAPNPVFSGDLEVTFRNRCSACHGPGKMHPKDWADYATAYANRALIDRRVWEVRDMPMGGNISENERDRIHKWIEGGAPESGSGGPSPSPSPMPTATPGPVVKYSEVKGIFENRCKSCHDSAGQRPWLLDYEDAKLFSKQIGQAVAAGVNHPPQSPTAITEPERLRVQAWIDSGAPN